jgi:hypothetical protein
MLNELYHLSSVLEKEKISMHHWHKYFKPLPNVSAKKPCFLILINPNNSIVGITPMKKEHVVGLRKWEPSNGNSFPGFNIQPLYRIISDDKKKILKKWREGKEAIDISQIKKWCTEEQAKNWDAKFAKKMNKCLCDIPKELQSNCKNMPNDYKVLNTICDRVISLNNEGDKGLFHALELYCLESFEKDAHASMLLSILIHEGSSNKKAANDRGTISVFMDIPDWQEYPTANEKTIFCINDHLINSKSAGSKELQNRFDDAFGHTSGEYEDKLPEVKLPVIGSVKLRAMTSESPCQYRYGTIDAKSFRIGGDSRKRVKAALEWLSNVEREGETWGRADGKELLFAYPAILPKIPLKLASCLGARKIDNTEARFAKYAEDVMACLKGLASALKDVELRVFSLRKMDKARTKVVFHRNYSAQRLADATSEWQQGCANIPFIQIKTWGKEKGEIITAETEIPFPLQIADCLNVVWKLDGTSAGEVNAIAKSRGIELLLDESVALRQVPHLLSVALQNGKGLFLALGGSLHSNDVVKLDGLNKNKQLMPAIMGLLLWKLGIGKESYMNNSPYLIGRMLKFSDELHALYCKEVRNDKMPPQLLGNALMIAALDSPTQALAQLALRIAPYLGWARTNSTASAGLSRYFLKELGSVESKLRDKPLPARLDDAAKAQMLLGYIAGNAQNQIDENNNQLMKG